MPLVLVWGGGDPESYWGQFRRECADQSAFRERAARFVLVRVEPDQREGIPASLGALEEKPAVFLLDFRGVVLFRWSGEMPKRTPLFKEMSKAQTRNALVADQYRLCQEKADKARYAVTLEEYRKAVLLVLEAEHMALPAESPPAKAVAEARKSLEERYRVADAEARDLEDKKRYEPALEKYQAMREQFPFPERLKELDRKIARLMHHLGLGG